MTAPAVLVFADAERAAIDVLKAELALRTGIDYVSPAITVGVEYPGGSAGSAEVPHVQVAHDGTPTIQEAAEFATVRLTAWHTSRTSAKRLVALCKGVLDAHRGTADVHGFRPLTGPQPATDPDTGLAMCTLTVRVSVRAHLAGGIP